MSTIAPAGGSGAGSKLNLKTIVKVNEASGEAWKEIADVASVSRNGASFELSRPCTVGRLVMLVLPLDPDLRAYDKEAPNYPIIGLVQYCNEGLSEAGQKVFHTGVAFIGKNLPDSYKSNPLQSYRISGMKENGLWQIIDSRDQFKPRRHPRFSIALGVTITLLGQPKGKTVREQAYTQNVSVTGASVVCSLEAKQGDRVKIGCKEIDFYAIAHVRARDVKDGKPPTLHLEFIDAELPMDKVYCGQADVRPSDSGFVPPPANNQPAQRL
jgi:hypothetical protein